MNKGGKARISKIYFGMLAIACCLSPVASIPAHGWGLTGHKMVTDRAVRLLPTRLQDFYWENREVLQELSIQADLRRDWDRKEAPKHYIDLEHYSSGPLPRLAKEAVRELGMGKLSRSGWLPWNTQLVYARLVDAMRLENYPEILRLSGDLSHYVADAHVPLHATENYDGWMTGDTGVHARFESRLVEQFPEVLPFDPRPAEKIVDVPARLWAIVLSSSMSAAAVLRSDRQNAYEDREMDGYSIVSARQTHGPIAARRMNDAAHEVASFWYTAWVEAGRPRLPRDNFSELALPGGPPAMSSGQALYYEGRYAAALPMEWPLPARQTLRRIEDYLRLETKVRLAKVHWSKTAEGEFQIRVTAYGRALEMPARQIEKALRRVAISSRLRFQIED